MTRLHFVKKARKDNPAAQKGESYYWWKFRYRGKQYSKARPKRSQLTQSAFYGALYDIEDGLVSDGSMDQDSADNLVEELGALRDECEYSLDNMPEQLRESSESGYMLQERIGGLEEWIDTIQALSWEDYETPEDALDAVMDAQPGLS